jgi:hypothetical protein
MPVLLEYDGNRGTIVPSLKLEYMPMTCLHFAGEIDLGDSFGKSRRRAAMGANRRIVQQREDGRWEVKAPRVDRASVITDTQSAAIDRARGILSKVGGGELTIKGTDGKIRDSDTVAPGNDPNPPRDRR